jgi:protein-S-isoprenylcysteine O-methyltransferase Ste14
MTDGVNDARLTPKEADASLGELFGRLTRDIGELFRKEVTLAKAETKEEVGKASRAAAFLVVAGLIGYLALVFASLALAAWIADALHPAVACLIVMAIHIIVAAVLFVVGRRHLASVDPVPRETVETLQEDMAWAKAQRS